MRSHCPRYHCRDVRNVYCVVYARKRQKRTILALDDIYKRFKGTIDFLNEHMENGASCFESTKINWMLRFIGELFFDLTV